MTADDVRRPDLLVLVCGTGTEVGKTWVAAETMRLLRARGTKVSARKLAQSFAPGEAPTDAEALGEAGGEAPETVCPPHRWYETPMAPPMAADLLGRPTFTVSELVRELIWPGQVAVGLVETAGGVCSPQADDGDATDVARALQPDLVVLVADAGLGTINAVRLALSALGSRRCVVLLNRYNPSNELHARNRRWLVTRDGVDVVCSATELVERLQL
ncbi:MAG: dethiobiotin synthase [Actinobacteria bacterium]|nr:dethiobiotin synthase [Actinomycetota bacterium]